MPALWCRIDRLWYPHPGVLEGSMTRQPFLCPLDHVFEVNVMLKKLPEEEFGPGIDIKEYSTLDNPSLPAEVKKSWLDVQLCKEGTQDCNASNDTNVGGLLKFPKHSSEETPPPIKPTDDQLSLADIDIVKVVGKGNEGVVQLVQHKWTNQFFALKVSLSFAVHM